MNKRFKGAGFDERIISYSEDQIDACDQFFKVYISAVGENTNAIINRRDHKYHSTESAIESRMINNFF